MLLLFGEVELMETGRIIADYLPNALVASLRRSRINGNHCLPERARMSARLLLFGEVELMETIQDETY
jgi:hypothetical protein